MAGGLIDTDGNDTVRGDHAYVHYQIPVGPRPLPLVFWHGGSTSGVGWESTPDGREGFQTLLVRRGFSTYVIDQPRRGRAGGSLVGGAINIVPRRDAPSWNVWRIGIWEPPHSPSFFPGIQLPTDERTIDQFLRQRTPETGPTVEADTNVALDAMDALLAEIGPSVLVLHSAGGKYGWRTRIRNDHVAGIVAYEPGSFVFPDDDPPAKISTTNTEVARLARPILVPRGAFEELARIPIQIVYGDNIQHEPSTNMGVELWRVNVQRARQFEAAISKSGGKAEVLDLPTAGLLGNTHFPFSDLNNDKVADLLVDYLEFHHLA